MPKLKRGLTATLTVGARLMLLPAAGQAATTFGSRLKHEPTSVTAPTCRRRPLHDRLLHRAVRPERRSVRRGAPVAGVITKFRIYAEAATQTQVTFRVADVTFRTRDPSTAQAKTVGTGPTVTIQPSAGSIQEFSGSLPVKKGEHLAIDATDGVQATYNSSGNHFSYVFAPPLVDGAAATHVHLEPTDELLVQGSIEPDEHPAGRHGPEGERRHDLLQPLGGIDRELPAREEAPRPQGGRQVRRPDRREPPPQALFQVQVDRCPVQRPGQDGRRQGARSPTGRS